MAQKVQVLLVDDLDGDTADETVTFSLDGKFFEIDLSAANAAVLRNFLEPYQRKGRRTGTNNLAARGADSRATQSEESARIRAWAEQHRLPISERGRIPREYRTAYEEHRRGNRTRLDRLMRKAGLDPKTAEDPTEPPGTVVPIKPHTEAARQERADKQARTVGRLSAPQEEKLRAAGAHPDGTGRAANHTDRSSYQALCKRGLMTHLDTDTYQITDIGRAWIKQHGVQLSA